MQGYGLQEQINAFYSDKEGIGTAMLIIYGKGA